MSIFVQTAGGSEARSPEITTSRDTSFWRFFARIITTPTDEQTPSAPSSISMGPGAALCFLSASNRTACPEGIWAMNSSPVVHFTVAVCKIPPLKIRAYRPCVTTPIFVRARLLALSLQRVVVPAVNQSQCGFSRRGTSFTVTTQTRIARKTVYEVEARRPANQEREEIF